MAVNERTMQATPQDVFAVLLDARQYPNWVVGAAEIRGVDDDWPSIGAAFHHRLGSESGGLKDKSEILDIEVPHRISLRTYARPLGVARVRITARPADEGTIVTLFEEPEEGTRLGKISKFVDPFIHLRNVEALRRLERVVRIVAAYRAAQVLAADHPELHRDVMPGT